jgi:predicted RNA-binding Zn-ribbon protein involved in translation (DUF1610 family)
MSCIEHFCTSCEYVEFNNSAEPEVCPKCGERLIKNFDESCDDYDDVEETDDEKD